MAALLHEIEHDAIVALLDRWNVVIDTSSKQESSTKGALTRMGSASNNDTAKVTFVSNLCFLRRLVLVDGHEFPLQSVYAFVISEDDAAVLAPVQDKTIC